MWQLVYRQNKFKKRKDDLMQKTEIMKIGRTVYEVVTSFNGDQNRDIKSALVCLMTQEAKSRPVREAHSDNVLQECG